jgi:hypothetical protein
MPTHWSGPLSTGETILMIINPFDNPRDITFGWREIPAFQDSQAKIFTFTEISTRKAWRSRSSVGFSFPGIPAHASIVMVVQEGDIAENVALAEEYAEVEWIQIHGGKPLF